MSGWTRPRSWPNGAGLLDPDQRFSIALRDREACANHPDLRGFDVVAFRPADRSVLDELVDRCVRLDIPYEPIKETPDGAMLDILDPDGTVLRFYRYTGSIGGFTGIETRDGEFVGTYSEPRSR